ncbi:MAG: M3 family oligoendopeptidase [Sporocytophaga sp.]|nr:M3 family oligoendopeptidase [Sporocytophaga sp.]
MGRKRSFLTEDFKVENWDSVKPFFEKLESREINNAQELKQWFLDRSELESVVSEDLAWRYIRMTGDTANKAFVVSFNFFISEIQPHIAPYTNALNKKAIESPYIEELQEDGFDILRRTLKKDFKIFREKNIPLFTQLDQEAQQFGAISGAMTVTIEGKELTLQQASDYLQSSDRNVREDAFREIASRRLKDKDTLDDLLDKLIKLRHEVALNADFPNFRDYMFRSMGRFDYSVEDCYAFHEAVKSEVVPLLDELAKERKQGLGLDLLKPWDGNINYLGTEPLKPFETGAELEEKTIKCFNQIDPYLGECISTMKQMGHLDLVSRKGKAPGGYNYPLDETGVPFIFMNATSSLRDLVTMVHEGGHALHSFLTKDLPLNAFKQVPSEVAELASMSMELISMEYWDIFFPDTEDLIRAKREHLESIISTLPWVATVDKFQHWMYLNPEHTAEQRKVVWKSIVTEFSNSITDWTNLEESLEYLWQKQLHVFEVPFYYIEYGMAQLGAIAVWKNYKENPEKGYKAYKEALKLGYTKPIGAIYEAAGIKFDFSKENIKNLIGFIQSELSKLKL